MAEPQIKAKLVLDTSDLDRIKTPSNVNGNQPLPNNVKNNIGISQQSEQERTDSKHLKQMSETITGPLKTAALLSIKSALITGAAALAAPVAISAFDKMKGTVKRFLNAGKDKNAKDLLDTDWDENVEATIEELKKLKKKLEESGDWERAREVEDEIMQLTQKLKDVRDAATEWESSVNIVKDKFDDVGVATNNFNKGVTKVVKDVTGVSLEFTKKDGIKDNAINIALEQGNWGTAIVELVTTLAGVKEAYDRIKRAAEAEAKAAEERAQLAPYRSEKDMSTVNRSIFGITHGRTVGPGMMVTDSDLNDSGVN